MFEYNEVLLLNTGQRSGTCDYICAEGSIGKGAKRHAVIEAKLRTQSRSAGSKVLTKIISQDAQSVMLQ